MYLQKVFENPLKAFARGFRKPICWAGVAAKICQKLGIGLASSFGEKSVNSKAICRMRVTILSNTENF